jgi:hypothetical protein
MSVSLRGRAETIHKTIRHAKIEMSPKVLIPWITTLPHAFATFSKPKLKRPKSESRLGCEDLPISRTIGPPPGELELTLPDRQRLTARETFLPASFAIKPRKTTPKARLLPKLPWVGCLTDSRPGT